VACASVRHSGGTAAGQRGSVAHALAGLALQQDGADPRLLRRRRVRGVARREGFDGWTPWRRLSARARRTGRRSGPQRAEGRARAAARRAVERGVVGRAAERGQRRRWRLTGGAGEGERGVRSDGRKFRVDTGGRVHFASGCVFSCSKISKL